MLNVWFLIDDSISLNNELFFRNKRAQISLLFICYTWHLIGLLAVNKEKLSWVMILSFLVFIKILANNKQKMTSNSNSFSSLLQVWSHEESAHNSKMLARWPIRCLLVKMQVYNSRSDFSSTCKYQFYAVLFD